jgi:tetratricopeptide (TPR) repeat protein
LSQTELAGDGISPSYVSLLEAGRRTPSPAVAALLAAKLGCSTSELLNGEPSEHERRVQLELAYAELALRHEGAQEAATRLKALLQEPDVSPAEWGQANLLLARAYEVMGDLPAAVATLVPLLERARRGEGPIAVPRIAIHLCHCYKSVGDYHRAVSVGEEALEACRAQGLGGTDDYFMLAATVMSAYAELGDEVHALTWARQLIKAAEASGSRAGQAALYWNASVLAEREGRIDEALHLSRKAIAHLSEMGDSRDLARLKVATALVYLAADPPLVTQARETLERSRGDLRRIGSEVDLVEWEHARSTVALLEGDPYEAEALARSAIDRLPQEAGSEQLCLAHQALGDALAAQGRRSEALEHYTIAMDLQSLGLPGRAGALTLRDLAERFLATGEVETAVRAYRGALDAAGVRNRAKAAVAAIATAGAPGSATGLAGAPREASASGFDDDVLPEQL